MYGRKIPAKYIAVVNSTKHFLANSDCFCVSFYHIHVLSEKIKLIICFLSFEILNAAVTLHSLAAK